MEDVEQSPYLHLLPVTSWNFAPTLDPLGPNLDRWPALGAGYFFPLRKSASAALKASARSMFA